MGEARALRGPSLHFTANAAKRIRSPPHRVKRKPVSRLDLARLARKDELIAEIEDQLARMRRHYQDRARASEAFGDPARSSEP